MSAPENPSTPHGLPAHALRRLLEVIRHDPSVERVVLYGSRAMGSFRPGSDIDLCVFAPAMELSSLLKLGTEIDELLLPWKVDLCVWHQIDNTALKDHIQRVGKTLTLD